MKRVTWRSGIVVAAVGLAGAVPAAGTLVPKTTEFGRGPVIVLVHGTGQTRTAWMPTARKLLPNHRVVMADLPGHGDTALPEPFSLEACAAALAEVLAKQKAESTIVVGQGMGGVLALMAASAFPGRVKGVLAIDAWLRIEQPIPEQQRSFFLRFMDERYDEFLKTAFLRAGRDSAQGVLLHAQAAQVPPPTMKAYTRARLVMDATRSLKALKVPMLYVGTERSWPADKSWATLAKESGYGDAPGVEARRLANCGPLVATEQPDSLAAVIAGFAAAAIAAK